MHKPPEFLVLSGDGINCERETAAAFVQAGGRSRVMHINDLLDAPETLRTLDGLALPGGFSFGDELGSGQIMALKIKHKLGDAFRRLTEQQKPIIGICNGFQVLVKLGLLPFADQPTRTVALAPNRGGGFMDRWVDLHMHQSRCLWTDGMDNRTIRLPVRHGEGRVAFAQGREEDLYQLLLASGQIPMTYAQDINGSYANIAALTDATGTVLGLMPHPEAFMHSETAAPPATAARGDGFQIFENIIRLFKGQEQTNARLSA